MLGEADCPLGLFFPYWKNWQLGRDQSVWSCVILGEGKWSMCSHSSYPFNAVCLGLQGTGGPSALPHVLGSFQWCLVFEWMLVVLLVRRSKLRDDLDGHLGDDTLNNPVLIMYLFLLR